MAQRCALLWSCVTRSRNQFYVFAFLVVRDLRLRFELRNSQPQFVFRFCDFLDVNLQDFVWKFFAEEHFLISENGTYIGPARGKDWAELPSWSAPLILAPARTPQKPQIFGRDIFAVLLYNAKSKQSTA